MLGQTLPPLTVETLVNGGAGLARYEGRVVFIPHTCVGDVVKCRITKNKKKFLEAKVCEIVRPASARRQPFCSVAGDCGGCQWQHLPYSEQLYWKEKLFRDSLMHQCAVDSDKILPIIPTSNEWGYRSRVQIKCHNTATGFTTGFYRPKSHQIVSIQECPIIASELNILLNQLRCAITSTSFADDIPQIDLNVDDYNCCSAVIHYFGYDIAALSIMLKRENFSAALFIKSPSEKKILNLSGNSTLQIVVDQPPISLKYTVGSFAQINLEQNRVMVDKVLELAELDGSEKVLDLFCGMGNFSLPLSRRAKYVVGFEESAASINTARINGRLNGIENVEFYHQSAEGALDCCKSNKQPDLVVLDPPRSGAFATMKELVASPVKQVIYVSCDPQTLARDLKYLVNNGYELISSTPIDMFPQTYHCESMTLLRYPC
jgi:23S rRNA (uracil1939-C5)-methyltransferase